MRKLFNNERMDKKKLKEKAKRFKSLRESWRQIKIVIRKAQLKCTTQIRKGTKKAMRMPVWLTSKVKKAIKGRNGTCA